MARRKNQAAVALGRRGGKARLRTMTPEQRSELARRAAFASHGKAPAKPTRLWIVLDPLEDDPPVILHSDLDRSKAQAWKRQYKPDGILTSLERDTVGSFALEHRVKPNVAAQVTALKIALGDGDE